MGLSDQNRSEVRRLKAFAPFLYGRKGLTITVTAKNRPSFRGEQGKLEQLDWLDDAIITFKQSRVTPQTTP